MKIERIVVKIERIGVSTSPEYTITVEASVVEMIPARKFAWTQVLPQHPVIADLDMLLTTALRVLQDQMIDLGTEPALEP